jgi:uncharacterized glyoxalase superfamily protein PhnB
MTARGVRFVRPPQERPYGTVAVFEDLYGNLWDLVQFAERGEPPFPAAVPEVPVSDLEAALAEYRDRFGFAVDWGGSEGGIAGISRGGCRIFLTAPAFRSRPGAAPSVTVWINLDGREAVESLHREWSASGATIVSPPEAKPWKLHEFTAADRDGNRFRVFYDVSRDDAAIDER